MWPITPELATAMRSRDRNAKWIAQIMRGGVPIDVSFELVNGGNVTISSQDTRRSITLTLTNAAGTLIVPDSKSALSPYGNEIALSVALPGFTSVPLGVYGIQAAVNAYNGQATTLNVTGKDRSELIKGDKTTDFVTIAVNTPAADAIMTLVYSSLPITQQYSFPPISAGIAKLVLKPGTDRWDIATQIAQAAGYLLYFNPVGVLTMTPIPYGGNTQRSWLFQPGSDSVLVDVANNLDRSDAANIILVTADSSSGDTDQTLISVAKDTDPTSPTYVNGPFGHAVLPVSTTLLTKQADVDAFAAATLRLYAGITQRVQFTCMPLWHLDSWDVVELSVPQVGLSNLYVIDSMSFPIGPGTMSVTTRGVVVNA